MRSKAGLFQGYGNSKLFGLRLLAVLLTAASQPLLSAPFNWWPLHWFAWFPFIWAVTAQAGRGRLFLGFIGGTVANSLIFYWISNLISEFSNVPKILAILLNLLLCSYLSILWIVLAAFTPAIIKRFPKVWIFILPAILVALEFSIPQLFPYMQGISHYQVTSIFLLVSLTGIYGMSYLIMLSNSLLYSFYHSYKQQRPYPWVSLGLFVFLLIGSISYSTGRMHAYQHAEKKARKLKIGLIQSNIQPDDHSKMGHRRIHHLYMKMSQKAVEQGAQWVVWSEGEYKRALNNPFAMEELKESVKKLEKPLLLGSHVLYWKGKNYNLYNSAIHIDPEKGPGKRYDKMIRIPFGEYMPFEKELGFIYKYISWQSRYTAGTQIRVHRLHGIPYAFLICYEAIFPSHARATVNNGARFLVNITYDSWFGKTTAPYQHLMLSAARSAELGVPLARLATSGVSTSVDSLGRLGSLSPLFKRRVLVHEVSLTYLPSLYAKIGDVFPYSCIFISLFCLLLIRLTGHSAQRKKEH